MRKQLVATLGWTVVVGAGIATGIWLGSLGADVPADTGLLRWTFLIAGGATFIVRGLIGVVRAMGPAPEPKAPAPRVTPPAPPPEPEPVVAVERPARTARKAPLQAKKAPAKKQAPRKRSQ